MGVPKQSTNFSGGGGGGGEVASVNGKKGAVTLTATDVGADPTGTAASLVSDLDASLGTAAAANVEDFDAAGSASARSLVGDLASRPSAASVAPGTRYAALDDRDGTEWVAATSGEWAQAAQSVAAGSLLAVAEPSTAMTQAIAAAATDYRIAGLTVDFEMPANRVRVEVSELWIYQLGVEVFAQMSLWYSTDGWATKTPLIAVVDPTLPNLSAFKFNRFAAQIVMLPGSVAAGSSVSVGLHISTTSDTPTLTVGANPGGDRGAARRPYLAAVAL